MNSKTMGQTILGWVEVIISIRMLLFCIPVLFNKSITQSFSTARVEDWFIIVLSLTSLLYLLTGLALLVGTKFWKFIHIFVGVVVLTLTAALYKKMTTIPNVSISGLYMLPFSFAIVTTAAAAILKDK